MMEVKLQCNFGMWYVGNPNVNIYYQKTRTKEMFTCNQNAYLYGLPNVAFSFIKKNNHIIKIMARNLLLEELAAAAILQVVHNLNLVL